MYPHRPTERLLTQRTDVGDRTVTLLLVEVVVVVGSGVGVRSMRTNRRRERVALRHRGRRAHALF